MDLTCMQNPGEGSSEKSKRRKKEKAVEKNDSKIRDQLEGNLEAPNTKKVRGVPNNESQTNLLEIEESKRRKKKRKPKNKAVQNNGPNTRDQPDDNLETSGTVIDCEVANNVSKNNLLETEKAVEYSGPQIRDQMDAILEAPETVRSSEIANNGLKSDLLDTEKSTSRKKKRKPKKKAVENNGPQIRDQKDDNFEAPETVRNCEVANNELTSDLLDAEKSTSRKRKRKPKKKAVENNRPQIRDQTDDNLETPDTLRNCDVANNESKTDILKTETSKRRKKKQKAKTKALEKNGSQIMDQTDDDLEAPDVVRDIEVTNDESKQNPLETDLTDRQMADQPSKDKDSSGNLSNGNSNRKKKKRLKKKKKKTETEDEIKSADQIEVHTGSLENLTEETVIGKRKRKRKRVKKAKITDKIEHMTLAGSISDLQLTDENHERKIDGKLSTEHADKQSVSSVKKELGPYHGGNMNKPPVSLSSRLGEENHGPLGTPMKQNKRLFPCESPPINHPNLSAKQCGEFENGLSEMSDEVIVYQGKGFDEQRSIVCDAHVKVATHSSSSNMKNVECLCLKIPPIASVKRKLLILDLNGLLVDVVMPAPKYCRADIHISRRAIFRRPFCDDFLKFCFGNFDVAIWSSRSRRIIDKIVDYLLGDLRKKLLFCWDMSYVTRAGSSTLEDRHKPLVFKELRKIWENDDPNLPWRKGDYNESNTLLLDDSPYKALLNPMHTAIFPSTYHYMDKGDNALGPEGSLRVYLEGGLAECDNVQKYVEQHPFGQRAITDKNLSWTFYAKVLRKVFLRLKDKVPPHLLALSQDIQSSSRW